MRRLLIAATLLAGSVPGRAQCGPPTYSCSSRSTATIQTPNTPPISSPSSTGASCVAGASNGSGNGCYNSIGYDTSINPAGLDPILRVSDGTMLSGQSPSSTASGGDNDEGWSCTGRTDTSLACANASLYLLAAEYGGAPFVTGIKIVNNLPTVVAPFPTSASSNPGGGDLSFSHQNPTVAFTEQSVGGDPVIYSVAYSWDGTVGHSPTFAKTVVYDFGASCSVLPNGVHFNQTWRGGLSQDINDNVFALGASNVAGIAAGNDTVSVTNGSTAFTVSGPKTLATDGSDVDAAIIIAGVTYTIAKVNSATTGTLTAAYAGATAGAAAMSIPNGQGTGVYILAAQLSPAACAVYNTYTGVVSAAGAWTGGAIDTGCHGMRVHDGFLMRDGVYGQWSGAGTGVSCGQTSNFWQTGTTHAVSCTGTLSSGAPLCAGHNTFGYHNETAIDNPNFVNFNPADASSATPFTTFGAIPPAGYQNATNCEDHFSWRNATLGDTQPIIGSTANNNYSTSSSGSSWTEPLFNETYALTQGGVAIRFGHNFILGPGNGAGCGTGVGPFDSIFTAQQAIGTVSQDGRLWAFNSSMLGQLGTDSSGNTRADDFVIGLDMKAGATSAAPPSQPKGLQIH